MKLAILGDRGHVGLVYHDLPLLPEMEVAAVWSDPADDPQPMLRRLADLGHRPALIHNWRSLLADVRPDVVCVTGPFELHGPMCLAALRQGAQVVCEKPVIMTAAELEQLEALTQRNPELRLIALTSMRYEGAYLAAHAACRNGAIGALRLVNARKSYKLGQRPDYYRSRATYCGTIPWVGSHMVDLIHCFDPSGFHVLSASHSRQGNCDHGDLEIVAQCQFRLGSGVLADCSFDFLRPAGAATHGDNQFRLVGSRGVLLITDAGVTLTNDQGEQPLAAPETVNIFDSFIRRAAPPGTPLLETQGTLTVARACLEAHLKAEAQ